jgi:hypothetical protein
MVKTTLIDGTRTATLDAVLFIDIGLTTVEPKLVWMESILVGIRNECGEIYRAIGVTGMSAFVDLTAQLRRLGYRSDALMPCEAEQGFDAILSAPDACLLPAVAAASQSIDCNRSQ